MREISTSPRRGWSLGVRAAWLFVDIFTEPDLVYKPGEAGSVSVRHTVSPFHTYTRRANAVYICARRWHHLAYLLDEVYVSRDVWLAVAIASGNKSSLALPNLSIGTNGATRGRAGARNGEETLHPRETARRCRQ